MNFTSKGYNDVCLPKTRSCFNLDSKFAAVVVVVVIVVVFVFRVEDCKDDFLDELSVAATEKEREKKPKQSTKEVKTR